MFCELFHQVWEPGKKENVLLLGCRLSHKLVGDYALVQRSHP
jgi:hypothetical protein